MGIILVLLEEQGSYKTAQTIVGVQLTGVSQRVDPSGNPISEVYTFIAKDISGNVQKRTRLITRFT